MAVNRRSKNPAVRKGVLDAKRRQREQTLNHKRLLRDKYRPLLAQKKIGFREKSREWNEQIETRYHIRTKRALQRIREQQKKQRAAVAAQREKIRQQRKG